MSINDAVASVRARLVVGSAVEPVTVADVADAVRDMGWLLGPEQMRALSQQVHDYLLGAGPLAQLLRRSDVTDVLVNSPDRVWFDRGRGLERAELTFDSDAEVRACAQRLAASVGRALDDCHPWVDAALPDGRRLHAVIPPVAVDGTTISIRLLRTRALSLHDLVAQQSLDLECAAIVSGLVNSRRAVLVTGGTGSGKTTFVNTLLGECDPRDRVVIVEDTTELRPGLENVVSLQTRPGNHEGRVDITLADLVRQALRMRPDRVVVGEVRGAEVVDLLMALNTGHTGGFATLHANAVEDVPSRVHLLAAGSHVGARALDRAVAGGIDAVIHLERLSDGRRVVAQIGIPHIQREDLHVVPGWLRAGTASPEPARTLSRLAGLA